MKREQTENKITNIDIFILIIDGEDNMKELRTDSCVSLFKVINKPILGYQLEYFEREGIKNVHIIINKKCSKSVRDYLNIYQGNIKTDVIETNKEGVELLLFLMKEKLNSNNFMLVDGDIILNMNLSEYIDYHIDNKNLISLILENKGNPKKYLSFLNFEEISDVYGVDLSNNRVIYYSEKETGEDADQIEINKNVLKHSKAFNLLLNYEDIGCYIFNKSINYILKSEEFTKKNEEEEKNEDESEDKEETKKKENKKIELIKEELLPYLIKRSFSKKLHSMIKINEKNKFCLAEKIMIKAYLIKNRSDPVYSFKINDYSKYLTILEEIQKPYENILPIFFQTINNDNNMLMNFKEQIFRNLLSSKPFNENIKELAPISLDSYISEKFKLIENNTSVNRTVAGFDLTVKEGSKIAFCVIGSNVTIGKNCKINNCVIGDGAIIEDNCELNECVIEKGYKVTEQSCESKKKLLEGIESLIYFEH